jgi:hypothetical protein
METAAVRISGRRVAVGAKVATRGATACEGASGDTRVACGAHPSAPAIAIATHLDMGHDFARLAREVNCARARGPNA